MSPWRPRPEGGWQLTLWRAERWWRDLVPLLALTLAFYSVLGVESKVERQREGRRVAIDVLCGFANGVANAGRAAILAPVKPDAFRRNLERLGLPPDGARAQQAKVAADAYAALLFRSVAEQAKLPRAHQIVRDGRLDCDALSTAARSRPGE